MLRRAFTPDYGTYEEGKSELEKGPSTTRLQAEAVLAAGERAGGQPMSAMLGSSRRDSRPRLRVENGKVVLVERPSGSLRAWLQRLLARLETFFSPPESRL